MAIQKIFKGSDIQLNLNIRDKTNAILRVSDLDEYTIKLTSVRLRTLTNS